MSSKRHSSFDRDGAEQLLAALSGVVSAHVVTDGDDRPVEIHILAAAGLHPKQVVRNIESALSAGMGITIDRRIVSVAQIRAETNGRPGPDLDALPVRLRTDEPPAPSTPPAAGPMPARLEFVSYEVRRADKRCTCQVVVRDRSTQVVGTASGPDTVEGRVEAAARAIVAAVRDTRPGLGLRLEGASVAHTRGRRYVIVALRAVLDRLPQSLCGAHAIEHAAEAAAILASLQALNRC